MIVVALGVFVVVLSLTYANYDPSRFVWVYRVSLAGTYLGVLSLGYLRCCTIAYLHTNYPLHRTLILSALVITCLFALGVPLARRAQPRTGHLFLMPELTATIGLLICWFYLPVYPTAAVLYSNLRAHRAQLDEVVNMIHADVNTSLQQRGMSDASRRLTALRDSTWGWSFTSNFAYPISLPLSQILRYRRLMQSIGALP